MAVKVGSFSKDRYIILVPFANNLGKLLRPDPNTNDK